MLFLLAARLPPLPFTLSDSTWLHTLCQAGEGMRMLLGLEAAAPAAAPVAAAAKSAAAERKEEVASTLRARRRGARALLSESRLNPETGLGTTLGSGPMV